MKRGRECVFRMPIAYALFVCLFYILDVSENLGKRFRGLNCKYTNKMIYIHYTLYSEHDRILPFKKNIIRSF